MKTFKEIADIAGPFASSFSFVMDLFFESESERFERYFQDILKKLDEIKVKLDTIEELILNLEVKLSFMSKEFLKDIKFVNFEANKFSSRKSSRSIITGGFNNFFLNSMKRNNNR